ncbi:hypothetical protein LN042_35630 [Kitasatospora sp. RB6PN24]|uniref:hypothetical protein n=1 Tax=Kitasatospora humi TaxID=2893891 RepID=UPI001E3E7B0F|nr:hypothetical protein [Kitasatospora humi]MCC9312329.1 hypothetical protein [Kitasatospora humi]
MALGAPNPTRLAALLEATAPSTPAEHAVGEDRMLPVPDALARLVPGLPRGQAAEVTDIGLLLGLAGAAVRDPDRIPDRTGWCAVVGAPGWACSPRRRPASMWKTEERLRAVVPQVMVVVRPAAGGGERVVVLLGGIEQPAPVA